LAYQFAPVGAAITPTLIRPSTICGRGFFQTTGLDDYLVRGHCPLLASHASYPRCCQQRG
jgi:hypothetical protein